MNTRWLKIGLLVVCLAGATSALRRAHAQQPTEFPKHPAPPGDGRAMVVQLCDGETNLTLPDVASDAKLTPEQAQDASNRLISMWLAKQPPETAAAWMREIKATGQQSKATAKKPVPTAANEKQQPVDFSPRDYQIWKTELEREIALGDKIFHDDKLLGSTNGVSCAMCHPNAANTHPETYPKFQIQLKRVALLRDMINWCIENPSRGSQLSPDDPKMRALEAYIIAQRKGVPIEPGKH